MRSRYDKKKYVYVKKETVKNESPNNIQLLPNDMMNEIINNLSTYDQLSLCQVSKHIKCSENVKILNLNINYKKIAMHLNTFIIKNDILYTNILITDSNITRKRNFFDIETPGIPLSVTCDGYDMVLLTTNGLYLKRVIRERYDTYWSDYIKIDVDEPIISFSLHVDDVYIATPHNIIMYSVLNNRKKIINIDGCLGFIKYNYSFYYWTKYGLYKDDKKINIDNVNDILDITSMNYNKLYVLTTTGLYKNVTPGDGGLINLDKCTFKLMNIENVKHISEDYILLKNGNLIQNDEFLATDVIYMNSYESSLITLTKNGYYASGVKYYLENKYEKIL
jgi:hypothetical protein